ncbi:hypothetical protein Drorol1_Dr00004541, partial [Drosera rotundifolia]
GRTIQAKNKGGAHRGKNRCGAHREKAETSGNTSGSQYVAQERFDLVRSPSLSLTNPHDSPNPHISFPPSKNPPKSSHLRKSPKSQIHRNPRFSRVVYGDDFESARVYVFASNYVKTTKYAQFSWAVVNQVEHKSPVRRKFAASVQYSGK